MNSLNLTLRILESWYLCFPAVTESVTQKVKWYAWVCRRHSLNPGFLPPSPWLAEWVQMPVRGYWSCSISAGASQPWCLKLDQPSRGRFRHRSTAPWPAQGDRGLLLSHPKCCHLQVMFTALSGVWMPAFMGILEMKNMITVAQLTGPCLFSPWREKKNGSFPSPRKHRSRFESKPK